MKIEKEKKISHPSYFSISATASRGKLQNAFDLAWGQIVPLGMVDDHMHADDESKGVADFFFNLDLF